MPPKGPAPVRGPAPASEGGHPTEKMVKDDPGGAVRVTSLIWIQRVAVNRRGGGTGQVIYPDKAGVVDGNPAGR